MEGLATLGRQFVYQQRAQEARERAAQCTNLQDRAHWLALAEEWAELARTHRVDPDGPAGEESTPPGKTTL